jgi:hypothetical protein
MTHYCTESPRGCMDPGRTPKCDECIPEGYTWRVVQTGTGSDTATREMHLFSPQGEDITEASR